MNLSFKYCEGRLCELKIKCKRWIGHYTSKEVEEAYKINKLKTILEKECNKKFFIKKG